MKSNDNFFHPTAKAILEYGISPVDGRERERERGWVSCERIHAVEFCILLLAACGLKQHPLPTATPTMQKNERDRGKEKERKRREKRKRREYMRVAARYFYWPRLSEGSRYKKKRTRVAEREREKTRKREEGSVECESIRWISFSALIFTDG